MARLNWQNVDSPNFGNVTNALVAANSMFGDSMKNLQGVLARGKQEGKDAASNEVLARALQYTDNESLNKALQSGSLFEGLDRSQISGDTFNRLYDRSGELLNNAGTGIINAGRGIANDASQFNLDRSRVDAGRADEQFTNRFGANRLLSEINADLSSGDPVKAEAARARLAQNSDLLTRAGYDAPSIVSGALGQSQAGFQFRQSEEAHKQFMKNTANANAGREKIMDYISRSANADQAIRLMQRDSSLDPEVKKYGVDYANSIRDTNWAAPSPIERATGYNMTLPALPTNAAGQNSLFTQALTRTEASGFDTLFGNSQREGGRFAGIKPSQMTIGELAAFSRPDGEYGQWVKGQLSKSGKEGRVATPMGAAQIVGTTLRNTAKKMGLSSDTVFTPNVQMAMANFLAKGAIAGKSLPEAVKAIRGVWEGFKSLPDGTVQGIVEEIRNGGSVDLEGNVTTRRSEPGAGTAITSSQFTDRFNGTPTMGTPISQTLATAAASTGPDYLNNVSAPLMPQAAPATSTPTPTSAGATIAAAANAEQSQSPAAPVSTGSSASAPVVDIPAQSSAMNERPLRSASNAASQLNTDIMADRMHERFRPINEILRNRPNASIDASSALGQMYEAMPNVPRDSIVDAFNALTTDGGMGKGSKAVSNDVAMAIIRESQDSQDLRSMPRQLIDAIPVLGWGTSLFPTWDSYGGPTADAAGTKGTRGVRINMNKVGDIVDAYHQYDGSGQSSTNTAPINQQAASDSAAANVQAIQQQISAIEADLQEKIADIRVSISDPQRQADAIARVTAMAQSIVQDLLSRVDNTNESKNRNPYFNR